MCRDWRRVNVDDHLPGRRKMQNCIAGHCPETQGAVARYDPVVFNILISHPSELLT